jgi:hypothetical protein
MKPQRLSTHPPPPLPASGKGSPNDVQAKPNALLAHDPALGELAALRTLTRYHRRVTASVDVQKVGPARGVLE